MVVTPGDRAERSLERLQAAGTLTYTTQGDELHITLAPEDVAYGQPIPGWFEDDEDERDTESR